MIGTTIPCNCMLALLQCFKCLFYIFSKSLHLHNYILLKGAKTTRLSSGLKLFHIKPFCFIWRFVFSQSGSSKRSESFESVGILVLVKPDFLCNVELYIQSFLTYLNSKDNWLDTRDPWYVYRNQNKLNPTNNPINDGPGIHKEPRQQLQLGIIPSR